MPGSDKKTRSRETFAAVFEEQTRRFSAFELLGLSSTPNSTNVSSPPFAPSDSTTEDRRAESEALGQAQVLQPDRVRVVQGPDPIGDQPKKTLKRVSTAKNPGRTPVLWTDRRAPDFRPDRLAVDQTVDPQQDQTVDGQSFGHPVWPSMGQTGGEIPIPTLGPDRVAKEHLPSRFAPLLAPLQWAVWEALQEADTSGRLVSYRQLAKQTRSTIDGVRKAVRVIQKEKGILAKRIIRTAQEQGFRVEINREMVFRKGTLNEAKAILKRGLALGQTPDRERQDLGLDGLRMYVCRNIKQTDIASLLRIPPPEWNIREQTLVQIADTLPDMTAIEFRLSLAYLVKQASQAKEPIRNPNAWVKAAFEKNGSPLVTEREIEARLDQSPVKRETKTTEEEGERDKEELDLLRRYLACSVDQRTEIDRIAEGKAALLFKMVSTDKHAGVLNAARLEAIREYFTP